MLGLRPGGTAFGGIASLVPYIGLVGEVTSIVPPPLSTVPAAAYGAKIVMLTNAPGSLVTVILRTLLALRPILRSREATCLLKALGPNTTVSLIRIWALLTRVAMSRP